MYDILTVFPHVACIRIESMCQQLLFENSILDANCSHSQSKACHFHATSEIFFTFASLRDHKVEEHLCRVLTGLYTQITCAGHVAEYNLTSRTGCFYSCTRNVAAAVAICNMAWRGSGLHTWTSFVILIFVFFVLDQRLSNWVFWSALFRFPEHLNLCMH